MRERRGLALSQEEEVVVVVEQEDVEWDSEERKMFREFKPFCMGQI